MSGGHLCRRQKHRPSRQARSGCPVDISAAGRSTDRAGRREADVRWTSLPQAEVPTEPAGEFPPGKCWQQLIPAHFPRVGLTCIRYKE